MQTLADFVGIPYEPRGTPPQSADCWSLILAYAQSMLHQNWPPYFYDASHYMSDARKIINATIEEPGANWERVDTPRHGDVLIFRFKGFPVHCGVYIERDQMLHTMRGRNSTIEPLEHWRENLVAVFRWKGAP